MKRRRFTKADATGRGGGERFVKLHAWLLASPAYRSLGLAAKALLPHLYLLYRGDNNGELFMSVRTAAEAIGSSKTSAARALHELTDRGFIRPRQSGGFNWKARHATSWVLTEFGFAGQLASKDFMQWRASGKQNTVPPQGQIVPPEGQRATEAQQSCSICPTTGTDKTDFAQNLSHQADTSNLPREGGVARTARTRLSVVGGKS